MKQSVVRTLNPGLNETYVYALELIYKYREQQCLRRNPSLALQIMQKQYGLNNSIE